MAEAHSVRNEFTSYYFYSRAQKKQETAKLTGKIADLEASLSFSAH